MGPFEMGLTRFAEKAGDKADFVVRKVVLDIGTRLVLKSPVKTGRFRANWFYAAESRPTQKTEAEDKSGQVSIDRIKPAKGASMGRVHWFSNNLPYALPLERGSSKQAPLGIVGLTVMEFNSIVSEAAGAYAGLGVLGVE
jgi:hypothetical protein